MIVECPSPACGKKLGVGQAISRVYWEERDGLASMAGICPRARINGPHACASYVKCEAMKRDAPLEEEIA